MCDLFACVRYILSLLEAWRAGNAASRAELIVFIK